MVDKRYGIPFVAALVLNLVYWGVVGDWFGHIKPPETPKKDLVINLDMGQQEPPQEKKDPEKLKIQPDDKPVAGGGKAGSVLPDLSGKPTEGLKNLNPYLGGNETASVNLNGNTDNPVGNPGSGNVPGPGGGNAGNGGLSEEGNGSKGGDPGPGDVLHAHLADPTCNHDCTTGIGDRRASPAGAAACRAGPGNGCSRTAWSLCRSTGHRATGHVRGLKP